MTGTIDREITNAQADCACVHESARECLRLRYPRWGDDDFDEDDCCACWCHAEITTILDAYGVDQ